MKKVFILLLCFSFLSLAVFAGENFSTGESPGSNPENNLVVTVPPKGFVSPSVIAIAVPERFESPPLAASPNDTTQFATEEARNYAGLWCLDTRSPASIRASSVTVSPLID